MISAISGPLRSKRIHIGMDEAHGVSEGRYRQLFGYKDSTQVVRRSRLPPLLLLLLLGPCGNMLRTRLTRSTGRIPVRVACVSSSRST